MRLIDADALKEQVLLTMQVYKINGKFDEPLARFCKLLKEEIKAIDNAPTIELVKHGKNISENGFLCSVCSFGDFGGFHGYEPNYCPNCGAKMDKEIEDNGTE